MRWRKAFTRRGLKVSVVSAAVVVTLVSELYKHVLLHSEKIGNGNSKHHKKINKVIDSFYKHKEHFSDGELKEFSELVMIKAQMVVERLIDSKYFLEAKVLVRKVMNIASQLSFDRFTEWGKEKLREINTAEKSEGSNNPV